MFTCLRAYHVTVVLVHICISWLISPRDPLGRAVHVHYRNCWFYRPRLKAPIDSAQMAA